MRPCVVAWDPTAVVAVCSDVSVVVYPAGMASDPHPLSAEVAYLGVDALVGRFEAGTLTSAGLLDILFARIAVVDEPAGDVGLGSIAALAEDARQVAVERDLERARGDIRGPLHGVPVLIKDNIEVTGLPGAAGSTCLVGRPATDATLVTRLREAGAVVVGSTNLSEWANIRSERSTSGWSATGGLVGNPWALDRTAGGSSSGSGAALAAGLVPLAVGTETDGSIICPASVNGVVGLKPTVGCVPTDGVVPISASQDSPGPMGRTVADVARLFVALSGEDPVAIDDTSPRYVHATTWRTEHPPTDRLVDGFLNALGQCVGTVERRDVAVPGPEVMNDESVVLLAELVDDLGTYLAARPGEGVRSLADVVAWEDTNADVELPWFGHELFLQALSTGGRSGDAYASARERNLEWAVSTCLTPALDGADVLVAAAYGPAWKSDLIVGGHASVVSSWVTTPAAIAGWPIITVPIGLVHGLPVGLALIARPGEEWTLLAAAAQVELVVAATDPLPRPLWRRPVPG
jgi:amidase